MQEKKSAIISGFTFQADWLQKLAMYPKSVQHSVIDMILSYGSTGIIPAAPKAEDSPYEMLAYGVFTGFIPEINDDHRKTVSEYLTHNTGETVTVITPKIDITSQEEVNTISMSADFGVSTKHESSKKLTSSDPASPDPVSPELASPEPVSPGPVKSTSAKSATAKSASASLDTKAPDLTAKAEKPASAKKQDKIPVMREKISVDDLPF